jgi:hypothetical protein
MLETLYATNAVSKDVLNSCIQDYESRNNYSDNLMNKANPGTSLDILHKLCEQVLDRKLTYVSGNFYKHSIPYFPHTDFKRHLDNTINVVIPLHYTNSTPSLVIFDQIWDRDSVTWCMDHPVGTFEVNVAVKGCPYEYPVQNLTGNNIDLDLYEYVKHFSYDSCFGLSGKAYSFEPGNLIAFDNKRIHCTSSIDGEKLGISLRFK